LAFFCLLAVFFANFATIKKLFQKSKSARHPHTRCYICAKFDFLGLLSPEILFGETTVTHPDTQHFSPSVNLSAEHWGIIVYIIVCIGGLIFWVLSLSFDCQYKCIKVLWKTRLWNDLFTYSHCVVNLWRAAIEFATNITMHLTVLSKGCLLMGSCMQCLHLLKITSTPMARLLMKVRWHQNYLFQISWVRYLRKEWFGVVTYLEGFKNTSAFESCVHRIAFCHTGTLKLCYSGSCLQFINCNMVEWSWWDWSPSPQWWHSSVLWHCWLPET